MNTHLEQHRIGLAPQDVGTRFEKPLQQHAVAALLIQLHVLRSHAHASDILLPDGFDLRDLVGVASHVHLRELLVQERQQLARRHRAGEAVEVGDEDEEDRHTADLIGDVRLGVLQHGADNVRRHHVLQRHEDLPAALPLLEVLDEVASLVELVVVPGQGRDHECEAQEHCGVCDLGWLVHVFPGERGIEKRQRQEHAEDP
mmetsp:Transcript_10648/g.30332  ORF Transcript_10648/g.30332 Transcript_10648/m.30332 type:complete len:201 (-) Transcript_10648:209-811(-)